MSLQNENEGEPEPNITPADPLILIPSISNDNLAKKSTCISRFSGILYSLMASCLFTGSTFIIKQLGVDILDAYLLRFVLQIIMTLTFALYKGYAILGGTAQEIILQLLCCATGAGGFFLFFFSIRYIEISDASTLGYTRVVWTLVLSVIVYRERPSTGTLLALPLTFLGVVFVTQPRFLFSSTSPSVTIVSSKLRFLGLAMAFGCALTSAINVLLFKRLVSTSKNVKPSVLTLQFAVSVFIFLTINQLYKIYYLQTIIPLTYILSWRFLLSSFVCLFSIVGSVLVQKAIKREHPAVFSLLGSVDIILALILQNIFTPVRSNLYALLGSGLVISSVVLLGVSRIMNERRLQNKQKLTETKNIDEKNGKCLENL